MAQKPDPILERLDRISEKLDVLAMTIACKPNSEQINKLLGDKKTQKDQIRILKEYNLPTEIIALIVGTTIGTGRARVSEIEAEGKKGKPKPPEVEGKSG